MPRLLISLFALLAVGVPAYLAVVHGDTIDVGAFVYAVPIGAVAFALIASIGYRFVGPARPTYQAARLQRLIPNSPFSQLIFCAVGLAVVAAVFLAADSDARSFASDPSCAAGLTASRSLTGACDVTTGSVTRTWTSWHRGTRYDHVALALADGATTSFTLGHATTGDVWTAVSSRPGAGVIVQRFHGHVTMLASANNCATTTAMPTDRARTYFFLSIALAVGGLVSAVRVLIAP